MENKLSLDEVNSFIARFKSKKKGKNAGKINNVQKEENKTVSANVKESQTTQVKKEEPVKTSEEILLLREIRDSLKKEK